MDIKTKKLSTSFIYVAYYSLVLGNIAVRFCGRTQCFDGHRVHESMVTDFVGIVDINWSEELKCT